MKIFHNSIAKFPFSTGIENGNFRLIAGLVFWNYLTFFNRNNSLELVPQKKLLKSLTQSQNAQKKERTLKDQHKSLRESGQDILLEHLHWTGFWGLEVLLFSYRAENGTIRCRIKFCIQQKTLEDQHKSLGESGQDILVKHPHFTDFLELWGLYRWVIELRMVPLDAESNSPSSTRH